MRLLLTSAFEESYFQEVQEKFPDIQASQQAFIQKSIKPLDASTEQVLQSNPNAIWLFSSQTAIEAVQRHYGHCYQQQEVWVVGKRSQSAAQQLAWQVMRCGADGAKSLIDQLKGQAAPEQLFYFHGDKRLPLLPHFMDENQWNWQGFELYHNQAKQVEGLDIMQFDAIAFASPSAVEAFHQQYPLGNCQASIIAIGETTAQSIRKLGLENVFLANQPELLEIFKTALKLQ